MKESSYSPAFLDLLRTEFNFSSDDLDRIRKIRQVFGDPESTEWIYYALRIREYLKEDYLSGDINFEEMMSTIRFVSLGLDPLRRMFF